jgi:hypothetical protein
MATRKLGDSGRSHEAEELVGLAEAYVREVARRSNQSPSQVEPVIQAALESLLLSGADAWAPVFGWRGHLEATSLPSPMVSHIVTNSRLSQAYRQVGAQRLRLIYDTVRQFLEQSQVPASRWTITDSPRHERRSRGAPGEQVPVDLVSAIASTALLIRDALQAGQPPVEWPGDVPEGRVVELERENLLRVFDGWQALLARSISGPVLAKLLGVSRQRLNQLRREGRLLGLKIPIRRELHYPAWQFESDGQPLPVLPQLIEAAREADLDLRDLDALMVSTRAGEGVPLIDRLRAGDLAYVLGIIRAAGQ